jgi:hypothetical protein
MKFTLINDRAARVQVKGSILERIIRKKDKACGGAPTVSVNGCWIVKGSGGWVTVAAFGSDAQAQEDLVNDLEILSKRDDSDVNPDMLD